MDCKKGFVGVGCIVTVLMLALGLAGPLGAESGFFTSDCAGCHDDDTVTCAACHMHRGTISASADQSEYNPSDIVTVTLSRTGGAPGWIRGILYDHTGAIVDVAHGPTWTGDDNLPNPVVFPVTLQAPAPAEPGDYVWQAAWFGNNNGAGHEELRRNVPFSVSSNAGIDDDLAARVSDRPQLAVCPNPMITHGVLRFRIDSSEAHATLAIYDAAGRQVRHLGCPAAGEQEQELQWDGRDDGGRTVPAGNYIAVLAGLHSTITHPILVLR